MSAVILAVIVVMWAVVLVPMWLRRHDAATESRSVDRFSTAMRVLSRRSSASADRRYVLMPRRETRTDVHVSGAAATRRPAGRPATPAPPARPKRKASLAVRRRRVFLGLGGLTALTFLLMLVGVVAWPFQLVVDLVLASFVVHLRTQAKRAAATARERRRPVAAPAPPPRRYAPVEHPAYVEAPAYETAPAAVADPADDWAAEPAAQVQTAAATGSEDASSAWEPVPVPPPTYTMKPKAPPRRTWTPPPASTPAAQSAAPAEEPGAQAETDELDGILEHRRAVND